MNTINNVNNLYLSYSIKLFSNVRENKNIDKNISKSTLFPKWKFIGNHIFFIILYLAYEYI